MIPRITESLIAIYKDGSNFTEDPELYIQKVFGKNFEFSEKFLTSNIKPDVIIKALK